MEKKGEKGGAHQGERKPVHPIRKKAQEKKLRRVVEGEAACPIQRSTARREEELDGRAKKESRGAL